MPELIKAIAEVRDGLTLIAFLSLAVLVAFRTKKVPELFFGLVRDKLTKQQFSTLLHRFMTLGLIAFLALLYGTNGETIRGAGNGPGTMRGNAGRGGSIYELEWTAAANGRYFLRLGADPGTAYRVDVR